MMKLILVALACYFVGAYAGLMDDALAGVDLSQVLTVNSKHLPPAGKVDASTGSEAVPDGGKEVKNQTPEQAAAIFADDDEVENADGEVAKKKKDYEVAAEKAAGEVGARSFIGLRDNYCYTSIGSGIMSHTKCFAENPLKNRECPTRSCAYRPTYAIYKKIYAFRALQAPYMQQSVGAKLCKDPGQVCGCKKGCSKNLSMTNCKRRRTCQNKYGWEKHRIIIVVPMINGPPQYRRVWTKVKVSVACDCVN